MPERVDRRKFLQAAGAVALGLGLGWSPTGATLAAECGALSPAAWQGLSEQLQGPLLRPGDQGYRRAAAPWNLRYSEIQPAGIARCAGAADVRAALLWAQQNQLEFATRAGGHSYAGFSTTTGLQIDVSQMQAFDLDPDSGLMRVGAGARNSDVYAGLRPYSRALTHGRCPSVGIAGFVLGGGIGFNQRRYGLACDQLVETEIVTADGHLLRCNEHHNADLFWACRGGGGGNFGVNTSFTFQTFPVDRVTVYTITWDSCVDDLLPLALDLLPQTTERLGCKLSVIAGSGPITLELLGQLAGSADELGAIFAPLTAIAAPAQATVLDLPYWDGQDFLAEGSGRMYVHERTRYAFSPLPADGAATILDSLRRWPGTSAGANWKSFIAGGATAAPAPDATAFVHRAALMITSIELDWSGRDSVGSVQKNAAWQNAFHGAMARYTSDESYQNFIDAGQQDYLRAYYGANLDRLIEIKRRYDPENVFHFPQSIPLSQGSPAM